LLDRERDRRIVESDRQIKVIGVEPLTRNRRADIGFALVIRNYNNDGFAQHFTAGVLDRHTRRNDGAGTAKISVDARLIVEHTNPYQVVRYLCVSRAATSGRQRAQEHRETQLQHYSSSADTVNFSVVKWDTLDIAGALRDTIIVKTPLE
jgi:hypothetical protein